MRGLRDRQTMDQPTDEPGAAAASAPLWAALLRSLELRAVMLALLAVLLGMSLSENAFHVNVITTIAIFYILSAGYNVLFGYAGLVSLGHPALYAIGAYASVLLGIHVPAVPWLLTVVFAAAVAAVAGIIVALPTARLHAEFLALATLALTIAVEEVLSRAEGLTGGVNGLANVPMASVAGRTLVGGTIEFYYLCAIFAVLSYLICARLLRSALGRSLHVLRDSALAAASVGINPAKERTVAFAISGAFAGVAGSLSATFTMFIVPNQFGFLVMVQLLTIVLVGGAGTQVGPLIGAIFLVLVGQQAFGSLGPDWEQFSYSAVLVFLVLVFREGISGAAITAYGWAKRRRSRDTVATQISAGSARPDVQSMRAALPRRRAGRAAARQLLDVRDVTVRFGGVQALSEVSLQVRRSEIVGLIGPNGAGKTSLVNVITGVVRPTAGEVTLDGDAVTGLVTYKVARDGVGRTFQHPQLSPELTVAQNVTLGFARSGTARLPEQLLHLPRSVSDERRFRDLASTLMRLVEIDGYAEQPVGECPYGVQRRVELARALATNPDFILLDEIGAGLNDEERRHMGDLLRALVVEDGPGCLLIDHNMDLIRQASDRVVVMESGAILVAGTADEVLQDPRVMDVYLGRSGAKGKGTEDE